MVKNYWEDRERKWLDEQLKSDKKFKDQIKKYYDQATANAQNDINEFYMRFAKKENITMAEAMKRVKNFDVKGFEEQAKRMVKDRDFSDEANERLRIYNATMRINRLEMLKAKLGLDYMEATTKIDADIKKRLTDFLNGEAKRQAGILGKNLPSDTESRIKQLVNASYKGATFSERLWVSQDELKSRLDQLLTRSFIQGQNPKQLSTILLANIKDTVKNKAATADRIARTEMARVNAQYKEKLYKDRGVKKVEWIAETTACSICRPHDGHKFTLEELPELPVHPYCRCTFSPVFERVDEDT